ncbi:pentapeptide repeat-containing protein [Mucilaginibacter pedocola]|uniref:Pentapeptide repeat-containing protein n=1 Tax=Mucilaginibacter pedocola TaxID=1792845 RepID=A0A1S9PFT7_9SPHI|nr:pentapeptide repeat-containing protein [Mucilaginibacter pedocola]OOQ59825.1 hypothetical protein BC343_06680 [Mucilaginibacter pedocola]
MCNFQRKDHPGITCKISIISSGKLLSEKMPLDKKGLCIFHSRDIDFKLKNKFDRWLDAMLGQSRKHVPDDDEYEHRLVSGEPGPFVFDLRGAYLIGKERGSKETGKVTEILIRSIEFEYDTEVKLDYAEIADPLRIENCQVKKGILNFKHTIVNAELFITNTHIGTLSFNDARLNGGLLMRNCDLVNYAEFGGMVVRNVFQLSDVHFKTHAFFNSTNFACESVLIENTDFLGKAEFGLATFHGDVEIQESRFDQLLSFSNATFKGPVCFTGNKYEDNVQFTSNDRSNRMFYEEVRFIFIDKFSEVQQRLIFDNVNYYLISGPDRKELAALERRNKVTVGAGCIKYRVQTPLIHIDTRDVTGNIARELAYSFTNYFTSSTGSNLGVEFVDKRIDSLSLFYFTDEDISQVEFKRRLKKAETGYWDSGPPGPDDVEEAEISRKVDNYVSKYAIMVKMAMLRDRGQWSSIDTKDVLEAVSFTGIDKRTMELNQTINFYIDIMKIRKIVAQANSQVNIAEVIKKVEFKPKVQPYSEADFEEIKGVLTRLNEAELQELRQDLVVLPADEMDFTAMEKISLRLNEFAAKHGVSIVDGIASSAIFEILKAIMIG